MVPNLMMLVSNLMMLLSNLNDGAESLRTMVPNLKYSHRTWLFILLSKLAQFPKKWFCPRCEISSRIRDVRALHAEDKSLVICLLRVIYTPYNRLSRLQMLSGTQKINKLNEIWVGTFYIILCCLRHKICANFMTHLLLL